MLLGWASLVTQLVKNLPTMQETSSIQPRSVPGLGRSPGEEKDYTLQYSGLGNSMDYTVHGVTESPTQLSDFHFQVSTLEVHVSPLLLYTVEYLIPWPPLDARMEAKCSIYFCWPDAQVTTGRLCPSGLILFHPCNNSMK